MRQQFIEQKRLWELSQQILAPETQIEASYDTNEMEVSSATPTQSLNREDEDELAEMVDYEEKALNALVAQACQEANDSKSRPPVRPDSDSDDEYQEIFEDISTKDSSGLQDSTSTVVPQSSSSAMDVSPA